MAKIIMSISLIVAVAMVAYSKPWEPTPQSGQSWMDRHNAFVENSRNNSADIKIVFTGSSSIERWGSTGLAIWNAKYQPLGAVNYGIGGDRIENCLWRMVNGELDHINPKILVLYCGSNNIPSDPENSDIVQGIMSTLNYLSRKLPDTKILYVTFNPRGDRSPINATWERITAVNENVIALDNDDNRVVFDMFEDLIESWGVLNREYYASDLLHLSTAGYELWDATWNSTFFDLWNDGQ